MKMRCRKMSGSLTDFYDKLKSNISDTQPGPNTNLINVGGKGPGHMAPGAALWRNKAVQERDKLKEVCCKRIVLDIYCNILPLDKEYIDGNRGQMKSDVDAFLDNKDTTASKYLKSCYEKTKAPLLEFVIRSVDTIGAQFMKEADETLSDAQQNNVQIPPPESDVDSKETENQLIDVQKDTEYQSFIDKLKEKTVNKIVADVSKIINDKKEENEMTFDPKPANAAMGESTISVGIDYINQKLWKESLQLGPDSQEEMIGLAIRESTLNQIDVVFAQPYSEFKEFASRVRFGKGVLINESAINYFKETGETVQARYEPLYKEADGNKYDVANHEKVSSDGQRTPMSDSEAKKYLDTSAYKTYQSKSKNVNESDEFLTNIGLMIDQYIESCDFGSIDMDGYFTESDESTGFKGNCARIANGIRTIIKKIKEFVKRIIDPILRKIKGKTKAADKAAIINALASVNINPAKKADKFSEKVRYSVIFEERGGKHYFSTGAILDLYYYRDEVIPKLKEGKVPSLFKLGKNIKDKAKIKNIAVEDYKNLAMEILDTLLVIERKIIAMTDLSEKRKGEVLNKIMMISNQVNMFLTTLARALTTILDPLTEDALIQLKDINKVEQFIAEVKKQSPNNLTIIKSCLTKISIFNNWKCGNGTSRFYIPDPNNSSYGYKFALTSKGISDNQRELDIWRKAQGTDVQQYLIPIYSVSPSGLMVKVAAATNIGEIQGSELKKFAASVDKVSKDMNYTGDVSDKLFGFLRLDILSNPNNVGKYNGHPVIIDYANSVYTYNKK